MELLLIIKYSALFFFGLLFIIMILGFLFYKSNDSAPSPKISEEIKYYYPDATHVASPVIYYNNQNTAPPQQRNVQQKTNIQPRIQGNVKKINTNKNTKYTVIREL